MSKHQPGQSTYRILSLDGGGIRGVFPAAFLAKQENMEHPIASKAAQNRFSITFR